MEDCKNPSLSTKLDEIWKKAYDERGFHLDDGILYHRTKHTCVMTPKDREVIVTILHEFHDSIVSGHFSEDITLERVKNMLLLANNRRDVAEYWQKANRATGKKFGMMIKIQEPKSPWEIAHMDLVIALPPGGDRIFNSCILLLADRPVETQCSYHFIKRTQLWKQP
ncbi:hypothetical protein O181_020950 [Austropuccinia psidii MF-1]|uniref:Uncharacterized protein n=1 Tax=Austropuccinia psidii MF-1 TaxID=1389203 RepID=A0A9Q3CDM1_9BASI|nr:hypothetical protein [Austropuccinia psidii MF-1]